MNAKQLPDSNIMPRARNDSAGTRAMWGAPMGDEDVSKLVARAYAEAVMVYNKEHPPKLLCLRCLSVIGDNCDCVAMVLPVMPMMRENVIRLDDLFNADKRVKVGV